MACITNVVVRSVLTVQTALLGMALLSSSNPVFAQTSQNLALTQAQATSQPVASRMKTITNAQRAQAAALARANRVALRRAAKAAGATRMSVPVNAATLNPKVSTGAAAAAVSVAPAVRAASIAGTAATSASPAAVSAGIPGAMTLPNSCVAGILDYFNCGNYANSPLPELAKDANGNLIPVPNTGIRKFVNTLAGVGAENKNELGNYIPVAKPSAYLEKDGTSSDLYTLELKRYQQALHSDLPPTILQGYSDSGNNGPSSYLGPIIFATRDRPVRVVFKNSLPSGAAGNLFLPVDTTMKGDGNDANGNAIPQNRALLHLHGGVTPWISDGTPHQWITPDGQKGASQQNVPDMGNPGKGADTWYWTNHQSARMMWYHDHSYGLTRLNVYAGEAAPYILTEKAEDSLIDSGVLPNQAGIDKSGGSYRYGIPLVIQDKTFVPPTAQTVTAPPTLGSGNTAAYTMDQLSAEDPTWLGQTNLGGTGLPLISTSDGIGADQGVLGQFGQLWFPHVFMPNQNPNRSDGVNGYGRWDYGAWVWPPVTGLTHTPITTTDFTSPNSTITIPAFPNPSAVQESFMDTPLVNGTPYPTLKVGNSAYRFRILNASNERHWNLQFYYAVDAAGNPCKGGVAASACTEVKMVPTAGFPSTWPTDGRDGGVPDPAMAGPSIIQIGNEGGFLPAAVPIASQPVNYEYNRRVITSLNVKDHALLVGPAERADIVVDFSKVPDGAVLILYNDAPAPDPGFDSRLDYYTGDPDQSASGGAPTTLPGYGPNTRTVMQFVVSSSADPKPQGFSAAGFTNAMNGGVYAAMQDAPLVPEPAYGSAPNYAFIQDTAYDPAPAPGKPHFLALANATTLTGKQIPLQNKAIAEEFDTDWGRMTAQLGTELPFTNFLTQTTLQQWFIDPPTETLNNGEMQIWKITHNGVDTHSVHFHLFNVQVINRVAWDGTMYPPDLNEMGWKESVRMNPLTDTIVALKPILPPLPFSLPDNYRLLDPTMQEGATSSSFTNVDPTTNNPITTSNKLTNMGWEYTWHCHLLGHEENDMMRPMIMQVPPEAPTGLTATRNADTSVTLNWTNTAASASGFQIQRATDPAFTQNVQTFTISPSVTLTSQLALGPVTPFSDSASDPTVASFYRVAASKLFNSQVGSTTVLNSDWTGTVNVAASAAPIASLSPTSLAFGITALKTPSQPQVITLANTGTAPFTITSAPVLSGPAAGDFILSSSCGSSVQAKASCPISITFKPTVASAPQGRTAILTIGTSDNQHKTLQAAISGTGTALSVAPSTLNFNTQLVGTSAPTQRFVLTNVGTAATNLTGTGILLTQATGDYSFKNSCARPTIPAGGACTITVTFSPLAAGVKNATIGISTNDPAGTQTVTLTGIGGAPKMVLSSTSLSFTSNVGVASPTQVVTVSNQGTAPLSFNQIRLAGANPGPFNILGSPANGACSTAASVPAGGQCTVTLGFTPTSGNASLPQPLTASLQINIPAAAGASQTVALSGTVTVPGVSATPTTLNFVRTAPAAQTITVNSTGTSPLTINSIPAVSGQFAITHSCPLAPSTLPSGYSCTVSVTYKPTNKNTTTSTFTINTSATSPRITLNGR